MHYSFQDMNNIYLVLDLMTGGDLRYSKLNLIYIYLFII